MHGAHTHTFQGNCQQSVGSKLYLRQEHAEPSKSSYGVHTLFCTNISLTFVELFNSMALKSFKLCFSMEKPLIFTIVKNWDGSQS